MNHYEVLELDADCEQTDIKNAYRQLSKACHPDKNKNKGLSKDEMRSLSDRYMKIHKAYEVLSDPDSRAEYDKSGLSISQGDTVIDPYGALMSMIEEKNQGGVPDVIVGIDITLEDLYTGFIKETEFTRVSPCSKCDGAGTRNKKDGSCSECSGRGALLETVEGGKVGYKYVEKMCDYCRGTGLDPDIKRCKKCDGDRYQRETLECEIDIPAGAYEGYYVRLSGEGNYIPIENRDKGKGKGKGKSKGKSKGKDCDTDRSDVIVVIGDVDYSPSKQEKNKTKMTNLVYPQYKRGIVIKELKRADRADLLLELELSFAESICGTTCKIAHLDGSIIKIDLTESVVNGDIVIVSRKGMPVLAEEQENRRSKKLDDEYGDLFIRFKINRPKLDSAIKRKIWQTLTQTSYRKCDALKRPDEYCFLDDMIANAQHFESRSPKCSESYSSDNSSSSC